MNTRLGCRSHPPFVRPEQLPDGKFVEHTGDPLLFCAVERVYPGSFTRSGARQALLGFGQCKESEDAMWDAGFPGSAVLLEAVDDANATPGAPTTDPPAVKRWRAIDTLEEANLGFCQRNLLPSGRDILFCESGLVAPPSGDVGYFFLLDFARRALGRSPDATWARLYGDVPMCPDPDTSAGLSLWRILSTEVQDRNKDGTGDLVVRVARRHVPASRVLAAKASAACHKSAGVLNLHAVLPPAKTHTLEFVSSGESFVATPATKRLLDTWRKESPEGFNGMATLGPPDLD